MASERGAFPKRLKKARNLTDMSGPVVAEKLGISYSTYSKYESGDRSPDFVTLNAIADLLNVSTDYLLGRTDQLVTTKLNINDEQVLVEHYDLETDDLQARVERAVKKIMEERNRTDNNEK